MCPCRRLSINGHLVGRYYSGLLAGIGRDGGPATEGGGHGGRIVLRNQEIDRKFCQFVYVKRALDEDCVARQLGMCNHKITLQAALRLACSRTRRVRFPSE